jgi:hypothetical protein
MARTIEIRATAAQAAIPVIAVVLLELAMAVEGAAATPRTLKWRMHHGIQLSSTLARPISAWRMA